MLDNESVLDKRHFVATMQRRQAPAIPQTTILAIIALVAAVFLPLLVGFSQGSQEQTTVLLADVAGHARDPRFVAALRKAERDAVLVVIESPGRATCPNREDPTLCDALDRFEHRVTVVGPVPGAEPAMIVNSLYGDGPEPRGKDGLLTATRSSGSAFSLVGAFLTGLVIVFLGGIGLIVAPGLVIWWAARRAGGRRQAVARAGTPAYQVAPPATRPSTGMPRGGSTQPPRQHRYTPSTAPAPAPGPSFGSPPAPAPAGVRMSDPGGSAAATSRTRPGDRVVARTHFGPDGGYVDVDGLIVWAVLDPAAGGALPGQALQVVGHGPADSLTVSPFHR